MGFFAGALNGDDATPGEDFCTPPPDSAPTGTLTGTVTDSGTGEPLAGVTVTVARQVARGCLNNPSDTTVRRHRTSPEPGRRHLPEGRRCQRWLRPVQVPVTIGTGTTVQDFQTRRDWVPSPVVRNHGLRRPDYTPFGCGPGRRRRPVAVPAGAATRTWYGCTRPGHAEVHHDRPAHGSGHLGGLGRSQRDLRRRPDRGNRDYTVEQSFPNGSTFTEVASETFTPGRSGQVQQRHADRRDDGHHGDPVHDGRASGIAARGGNLPGPSSGCDFMDMSEIAVHGTACRDSGLTSTTEGGPRRTPRPSPLSAGPRVTPVVRRRWLGRDTHW